MKETTKVAVGVVIVLSLAVGAARGLACAKRLGCRGKVVKTVVYSGRFVKDTLYHHFDDGKVVKQVGAEFKRIR